MAHLKDLIDGESGWKSSLPEDQNLEVTEQKVAILFDKGGVEFKKFEEVLNSSDKLKESEANEPTEGATENVEVIETIMTTTQNQTQNQQLLETNKKILLLRKQMIVQFNMTLMTLQLMKLIIQKSLERMKSPI